MDYIAIYLDNFFVRLRAQCPIDTSNMLKHIALDEQTEKYAEITIAAPAKTGDYSGYVNYARKSPHKGWVEDEIKAANHIVESNINYDIYEEG